MNEKICIDALESGQRKVLELLLQEGQEHLIAAWPPAGEREAEKLQLLAEVQQVEREYPGGLRGYLRQARRLMNEGETGATALPECRLQSPPIANLTHFDDRYRAAEGKGLENADRLAFALVAGGLGERLGYDGIKMAIPFELISSTTYMQLYCTFLLSLQRRARRRHPDKDIVIPFMIMTSDGTCEATQRHLEEHGFFGLDPNQVHLFEQHLVPSLLDRDGRLATEDPFRLLLKPNGHGDIHAQLHRLGLARRAHELGKTHLVFIQDTNAQIVNLILPAVGVAIEQDLDFNFVCVPRIPREPIGAVVTVAGEDTTRTVNIEYSQLDAFLSHAGGDVPAANGYSAYPGNINLLVVKIEPYLAALDETHGQVAEFINPKYTDASHTTLQKPARVETLMQDLARSLHAGARIGVTLFDRDWALAALKNNLATASARARAGEPGYSAAEAEWGFYAGCRRRLGCCGMEIEPGADVVYKGIPVPGGARVVLSPLFSLVLDDAAPRIRGGHLGRDATLVLDGEAITLDNVRLEGQSALVIKACPGAEVVVRNLTLDRPGYTFEEIETDEAAGGEHPSYLRIRGYRCREHDPAIYCFDEPGTYSIDKDGAVSRTNGAS